MNEKEKSERRDEKPAGNEMDITSAETESASHTEELERQGMSRDLQGHIGRQLRASFDEVAREPIPDRFLQLLQELEKNGQNK
ncbi:NepR family anti-sigma factor [Methyloligella sp. 2.7D]|uniref:NepR family anti-sigma factor n=1 Tax=unclassified Methyloligella TaxID=2625955 RepID=UPI00157D63B7|nr:NepR family anti-sigma factor [Methyloligella sp. GL2]QKP77765.1 hypothetical protein HT051_10105 [Methyloligella sp. GL2]